MKDGVVLPILHLNGYKIANPTLLARISEEDLISYFNGLGYKPYIISEKYMVPQMLQTTARAEQKPSTLSQPLKILSHLPWLVPPVWLHREAPTLFLLPKVRKFHH